MPESASVNADTIVFEGTTPILPVKNLTASTEYYTSVLGFRINWQQPGIVASVSRGGCTIFLTEGDQGHPGTWLWVGVSDVTLLFREFVSKGATVRHTPTNYSWAYEMQIEDLDGNVLRFGSDPLPEQATGEWLDMRGVAWVESTSGQWSRVGPE